VPEAVTVVAKYRRVSTRGQLDGFGLDDQDEICKAWLDRHPEVLVFRDYVDRAAPGSSQSRPEMDRLVRDAHERRFNRILVPQVDRIGRSARVAYQWAWDMADLGIHFISVREGIDTSTDVGWEHFKSHVTYSEMEWTRIKERTIAGRELKISYGGWPGGPAPYGYKIVNGAARFDDSRKRFSVLVTDEYESTVLAVAVSLLVDDGLNFTQAAAELNARGLRTRSGVPWKTANLRSRLYSETIHAGYVVYRKTRRGGTQGATVVNADGTPVHGEQVRIGVPAIFSAERAEQLMKALKELGFRNGRREARVYPLSGRIIGRCGEPYTGAGRGGDDRSRAYRCNGLVKSPSCGEPQFDAHDIERAVWGELGRIVGEGVLAEGTAAEPAGRLLGDRLKYEGRVVELSERALALENLIEQKVPEYIEAGVDPTVLKASVATLQEELSEARRQRAVAEEWLAEHGASERRHGKLIDVVGGPHGCLDDVSLDQRGEVFAAFDIMVHPGAMEGRGKPGVKCPVGEWHWATRTLVPPDPSDAEWTAVIETLRPFFTKRHFTSKYDIRQQFSGMLYRLRRGLSWCDTPLTWGPTNAIRERQLSWWQKGAWPKVMEALNAEFRGEPVHRPRTLPHLTVVSRELRRTAGQDRRERDTSSPL
jgi:DNA invertase Pin-like site-specific DNA recombinase/transposase